MYAAAFSLIYCVISIISGIILLMDTHFQIIPGIHTSNNDSLDTSQHIIDKNSNTSVSYTELQPLLVNPMCNKQITTKVSDTDDNSSILQKYYQHHHRHPSYNALSYCKQDNITVNELGSPKQHSQNCPICGDIDNNKCKPEIENNCNANNAVVPCISDDDGYNISIHQYITKPYIINYIHRLQGGHLPVHNLYTGITNNNHNNHTTTTTSVNSKDENTEIYDVKPIDDDNASGCLHYMYKLWRSLTTVLQLLGWKYAYVVLINSMSLMTLHSFWYFAPHLYTTLMDISITEIGYIISIPSIAVSTTL